MNKEDQRREQMSTDLNKIVGQGLPVPPMGTDVTATATAIPVKPQPTVTQPGAPLSFPAVDYGFKNKSMETPQQKTIAQHVSDIQTLVNSIQTPELKSQFINMYLALKDAYSEASDPENDYKVQTQAKLSAIVEQVKTGATDPVNAMFFAMSVIADVAAVDPKYADNLRKIYEPLLKAITKSEGAGLGGTAGGGQEFQGLEDTGTEILPSSAKGGLQGRQY